MNELITGVVISFNENKAVKTQPFTTKIINYGWLSYLTGMQSEFLEL